MDGDHLIIVNILTIDVLPGVKKNEVIEFRMAAFAVNYRRVMNLTEKFAVSFLHSVALSLLVL